MCGGREKWFGPHQSLCHGGLIVSREVLLQGQHNTVSGDGGQDHVLKWCKGRKVKESTYFTTEKQKETQTNADVVDQHKTDPIVT